MVAHARQVLARIRWSGADVERFLGRYLTAPKPHVAFASPRRPLARAAFARQLRRRAIVLDLKTQMLYRGARLYVNGEEAGTPRGLRTLADRRRALVPPARADLLYDWYRAGYLHLERSQ